MPQKLKWTTCLSSKVWICTNSYYMFTEIKSQIWALPLQEIVSTVCLPVLGSHYQVSACRPPSQTDSIFHSEHQSSYFCSYFYGAVFWESFSWEKLIRLKTMFMKEREEEAGSHIYYSPVQYRELHPLIPTGPGQTEAPWKRLPKFWIETGKRCDQISFSALVPFRRKTGTTVHSIYCNNFIRLFGSTETSQLFTAKSCCISHEACFHVRISKMSSYSKL